jgi:hypothetical protein
MDTSLSHLAPIGSGPSRPQASWDPEEVRQARPLFCAIDDFRAARRREPLNSRLDLRLSNAIHLLPGLAATTRGLLTRQLLLALDFDERRLGEWRLEHKLVQALALHGYAPGCIPVTRGLDRIAHTAGRPLLRQSLRADFPNGFVVKTALGDSSGDECEHRTEAAVSWIESGERTVPPPGPLTEEQFIVQELVRIRCEYRVHTVEDAVIEDLTVRRHHGAVGTGERTGPNQFVRTILDTLPAGLTAGSLLAWDVALAEDGSLSVIEVNIGGIHTVYHPGFHSSGFYHHQYYGCVYTARLLRFVERTYDCSIRVVADSPDYPHEHWFYQQVEDWKTHF